MLHMHGVVEFNARYRAREKETEREREKESIKSTPPAYRSKYI